MPISSRLLRAAARLLVPGLLLAAAPRAAQAQDCAYGSLAFYMANPCRLAGYDFFDFFLISSAAGTGPTEAFAPDMSGADLFLDPFSYVDPVDGALIFGFDLDGFLTYATADGGNLGEGTASAFAVLGFQAAHSGSGTFAGAGADMLVGGDTDTPGRTELYQSALAGVFAPATMTDCLDRFLDNVGPGLKAAVPRRRCATPNPNAIIGVYTIEADVSRSGSPRAADGSSFATITTVAFRAVPEPATVALVGGGLLALAGVARRRRA
jgi:hypothetical protein